MTNEQKLLKLIQIAVENGWKAPLHIREWLLVGNESYGCESLKACTVVFKKGEFGEFSIRCGHWEMSIDYLILNFEESEISFIEALCKHCSKNMSKEDFYKWSNSFRTHIDFYFEYEELEFLWSFKITTKNRIDKRPTSKRLEGLFETFSHLLC